MAPVPVYTVAGISGGGGPFSWSDSHESLVSAGSSQVGHRDWHQGHGGWPATCATPAVVNTCHQTSSQVASVHEASWLARQVAPR